MKIVDAVILLSKEKFVAKANPGAVMRAEAKTVPPPGAGENHVSKRQDCPAAKLTNRAENLTISHHVHPLNSSTYFPLISLEWPRMGETGNTGTLDLTRFS